MSGPDTKELAVHEDARRTRLGRIWRGFTGSLAAGMVALAIGVLGAALVSSLRGVPGPGMLSLVGHPIAAVLGLAAQRVADREQGTPAGVAAAVLLAVTALALWLLWWQ